MMALLFHSQFKAPLLSGLKTETRRLPVCRRCSSHVLERWTGDLNRCLACGETSKIRWRMTPGVPVAAVNRPLYSVPPRCADNADHGPMQRVKDAEGAVTGYWCDTCGAAAPARFALLMPLERRLEPLDAITEEAAQADGLCSKREFINLVLSFNGAQAYAKKTAPGVTLPTPSSVAVEVYRFRCDGP